ncbi:MAG: hypothetical protein HYX74_11395 [Acidobacteria bacterium]|nr:hypothetical protein [Acidobacteriota bacterium]
MRISKRFFQIADEALSSVDSKAQSIFAGYSPWPQKSKDLYGTYYYREAGRTETGFFLGYLLAEDERRYLNALPPECFFFIFVHPISTPLHRKLVRKEDGLFSRLYRQLDEQRAGVARFHLLRDKLPALYCKHSLRTLPTSEMSLTSRRFFHDTLRQVSALGIPRRLAVSLQGDSQGSQRDAAS